MPQLDDVEFHNSVIYILDHDEHGAFGVIINNPLNITFASLLNQVEIDIEEPPGQLTQVLRGGPVDAEHGLVLHAPGPKFSVTHDFCNGVSLSSSPDILEAIANGQEPDKNLVLLGHCGWAPGQLEMEIAANAWLTCEANTEILFSTALSDRRQSVADLLGIDLSHVVGHSGRA